MYIQYTSLYHIVSSIVIFYRLTIFLVLLYSSNFQINASNQENLINAKVLASRNPKFLPYAFPLLRRAPPKDNTDKQARWMFSAVSNALQSANEQISQSAAASIVSRITASQIETLLNELPFSDSRNAMTNLLTCLEERFPNLAAECPGVEEVSETEGDGEETDSGSEDSSSTSGKFKITNKIFRVS